MAGAFYDRNTRRRIKVLSFCLPQGPPEPKPEMTPEELRVFAAELRQVASLFDDSNLEATSAADLRTRAATLRDAAKASVATGGKPWPLLK